MKKTAIFLLICLLCGLLGGCGSKPMEQTSEPDYSALIVPPVDLTITDCISEQQLTTILGYPMSLLGVGEEGAQAVYQTEDSTCVVTVHMLNQTRAGFDAVIGASTATTVLQEGLGESAYWFVSDEMVDQNSGGYAQLMVYSGGYAVDVALACADIPEANINAYVLQIAETILSRLPQGE